MGLALVLIGAAALHIAVTGYMTADPTVLIAGAIVYLIALICYLGKEG